MAKRNKKNRAIVSGILVGLASIFAIASQFDLELNVLNSFMISTLLFIFFIVLLAALAVLAFKGFAAIMGRDNSVQANETHAAPPDSSFTSKPAETKPSKSLED